jgi:hypothetical protein
MPELPARISLVAVENDDPERQVLANARGRDRGVYAVTAPPTTFSDRMGRSAGIAVRG